MAEITAADIDYLNVQTDHIYRQAISSVNDSQSWQIDQQALGAVPLSLQRRVIKQLLSQVLPVSPNFAQIEKLVTLLSAANRSQSDPYPGNWIAVVRKPFVSLEPLRNKNYLQR
jgi:tRNA(Ile)-lysidine synthase